MTNQINERPHVKCKVKKAKAALRVVSSLAALNIVLVANTQQAHAAAASESKVEISIPAQSMETALNSFAKQVGKQIVFYSDDARSLRAGPVSGSLTEREALDRILRNSGLEYLYINDRTIGIRRKSSLLGLTKTSLQAQDPENADQGAPGRVQSSDGTIIVTGRKLDQVTAIEKKREAKQIIDTITADQSSRLPDNNVVESLGRIPGVSFQRDSNTGDGTNISIRGLDAALNNIQFDGINAGTSGNDGTRRVGLEGISADDIAELRVAKSLLPEDEGEGIGGAVNIITKTALERGKDRFTFGIEGRAYDFNSREGFKVNAGLTKIFSDNFGVNVSASFRRRETLNYRINSSDLEPFQFSRFRTIDGQVIDTAALIALNDAQNAADFANGDTTPDDDYLDPGNNLNDLIPGQLANTNDLAFQRQSYSVNDQTRDTFNISGSLDWQVSDSTKLTLGGRFNHETRDQDIHKFDFSAEDEDFSLRPDGVLRTDYLSSITNFRLEIADRERTSASIYLRGKSDFGRLKLNYQASYSTEENKSPDSEVEFRQNNTIRNIFRGRDAAVPVTSDQQFAPFTFASRYVPSPNLGVLTIPGFQQALGDVNNSYKTQLFDIQQVDDNVNDRYALRFDGEYDLDAGILTTVKFGAKYERSDTKTNSRRFTFGDGRVGRDGTFSPVNNSVDDDVAFGDYDLLNTNQIVSLDEIGNPLAGYPITGIPRIDPDGFRSIVSTFNRTVDDRAPSNFTIRDLREEIWAGYAQAEFETDKFLLVGGVRVEHYKGSFDTTQRIETARFVVDNRGAPLNGVRTFIPLLNEGSLSDQLAPVATGNTDTQILPRLNARYELADNLFLRGGFGYSLARPSLRQLSQAGEIDFDINIDDAPTLLTATTVADIVAAGGLPVGNIRVSSSTDLDIEQGNPNLKPARSRNIDLSLEWYPRSGTSLSVGLFHKRINNFIFINNEPAGTFDGDIALTTLTDQFSPDTVALFAPFGGLSAFLTGPGADLIDVSLLQPQNGGTATIKGVEFGVNHQFDWAPRFLKDFGFNGNITFTDSSAELPVGRYDSFTDLNVLLGDAQFLEDLPLRSVPFFNSPRVTANALLYYDAHGLDIGLSYSYQSSSFNELDEFGFNQFDDSYGQFDFSIAYELPQKIFGGEFKVYLEIPDFTDGGSKPTSVQTVGRGTNLYDLVAFNGREYRFGIRGKF